MAAEHEASVAEALQSEQSGVCDASSDGSPESVGVCNVTSGDVTYGSLSGSSALSCGGQRSHWLWMRRNNRAAAYPTDFLMLSCSDEVAVDLKVRFQSL